MPGCPLGWLWAQEMDEVSVGCSPLLGTRCCPWLHVTGTVPNCPALSGVPGTPVVPDSKEFQCFPGLCLKQFPSAMTLGDSQCPNPAQAQPCVWLGCLGPGGHTGVRTPQAPQEHWGRQSDPTALSQRQRLILFCHKRAQVQCVFEPSSAFLTAIHQNLTWYCFPCNSLACPFPFLLKAVNLCFLRALGAISHLHISLLIKMLLMQTSLLQNVFCLKTLSTLQTFHSPFNTHLVSSPAFCCGFGLAMTAGNLQLIPLHVKAKLIITFFQPTVSSLR